MNMRMVGLCLLSATLGAAVTWMFLKRSLPIATATPEPEAQAVPTPATQDFSRDAAPRHAAREVAELKARIAELEANPERVARARSLDRLTSKMTEALAKKDVRELMSLALDLSRHGEAGWPAALDALKSTFSPALLAERMKAMLSFNSYSVFPPEFLLWAVRDPSIGEELPHHLAGAFMNAGPMDQSRLLEELDATTDARVASMVASKLLVQRQPCPTERLLAAARRFRSDQHALGALLRNLQVRPDGKATLQAVLTDPDPIIAEEARVLLLEIDAPVEGLLYTHLAHSDDGVRRGDIVTRWNDRPLTDALASDWNLEVERLLKGAVEEISLEVLRNGQPVRVTLRAEHLKRGSGSRWVRPGK